MHPNCVKAKEKFKFANVKVIHKISPCTANMQLLFTCLITSYMQTVSTFNILHVNLAKTPN